MQGAGSGQWTQRDGLAHGALGVELNDHVVKVARAIPRGTQIQIEERLVRPFFPVDCEILAGNRLHTSSELAPLAPAIIIPKGECRTQALMSFVRKTIITNSRAGGTTDGLCGQLFSGSPEDCCHMPRAFPAADSIGKASRERMPLTRLHGGECSGAELLRVQGLIRADLRPGMWRIRCSMVAAVGRGASRCLKPVPRVVRFPLPVGLWIADSRQAAHPRPASLSAA